MWSSYFLCLKNVQFCSFFKIIFNPNRAAKKNVEDGTGKATADFTKKPFVPDERCSPKDDTEEEKKLVKKVRKMTKRLWSHTSKNGLFITVWPGTKTHNAFVGIAVNKGSV